MKKLWKTVQIGVLLCALFSSISSQSVSSATMISPDNGCVMSCAEIVENIDRHVCYLRAIHKRECLLQMILHKNSSNTAQIFHHALMYWCENIVLRQGDVDALFETWDVFKAHVQNDPEFFIFIREFSVLLFFIYQNILQDPLAMHEICHIYQHVLALPMEDVLSTLDGYLTQATVFFGKHDFPFLSTMLHWVQAHWKISASLLFIGYICFIKWSAQGDPIATVRVPQFAWKAMPPTVELKGKRL